MNAEVRNRDRKITIFKQDSRVVQVKKIVFSITSLLGSTTFYTVGSSTNMIWASLVPHLKFAGLDTSSECENALQL